MQVFITGGTGFFGKSILDYRLRHPAFTDECIFTILSRDPESFLSANPEFIASPKVRWVKGDVRDFDFKAAADDYDAILHAATPASAQIGDAEMLSIIRDGTSHVVEFALAMDCRRVLFTSSGAVYGQQVAPVDETVPCRPMTAYGRGKLAAERLLLDSGLEVKIARCFAFTGPYLRRDIHYAIGNFIRDALANRAIVVRGDGSPLRSYLHADDLVRWLFTILEKGEAGRAYNVGSDCALSIRELAETVRRALDSKSEIVIEGSPRPGEAPAAYVPVIARARDELGLSVSIPLERAIRDSV